jgi:hypothetical protein
MTVLAKASSNSTDQKSTKVFEEHVAAISRAEK